MFGLGGKVAMGMGVAVLVMGGAFFWYYKSSQGRIEQLVADKATLVSNVAILETTVEEQNADIQKLDAARNTDQETVLRLSEESNQYRAEVARLRETFARHDLNRLSIAKPGLIERIINRGTAKEGEEFVDLTAPRLEVTEQPEVETSE